LRVGWIRAFHPVGVRTGWPFTVMVCSCPPVHAPGKTFSAARRSVLAVVSSPRPSSQKSSPSVIVRLEAPCWKTVSLPAAAVPPKITTEAAERGYWSSTST